MNTRVCLLTTVPNERALQRSQRACRLPPRGPGWHPGAVVQNDLDFIPHVPHRTCFSDAALDTELDSLQSPLASMAVPCWLGLGSWSSPSTSCSPAQLPAQDVPLEADPEIDKGGNQLLCPPSPGCQGQQDPKTQT